MRRTKAETPQEAARHYWRLPTFCKREVLRMLGYDLRQMTTRAINDQGFRATSFAESNSFFATAFLQAVNTVCEKRWKDEREWQRIGKARRLTALAARVRKTLTDD